MRVAFVISTLKGGGAERMLVNLVNALPHTMEIHLIVLKTMGQMAEHLSHPRLSIHTLGIKSLLDIAGWARFARLLRRIRPDVVHSHMTLSNLVSRAARLLSPAPILVNHEHGLGTWKGRVLCLFDGATQSLADRVITVSDASRNIRISRERINPQRIVTMYNAIDWPRWSGVTPVGPRSELSLGVAASLTPVKRVDLAIRMLAALRVKRPDARLLIAGDGPELACLKAVSHKLNVDSHVEFLGFVRTMTDFYSKVDVVMLTSLREDCPMALLEALAAGRFVVGPATGGVPELLRPPVDGAIVANDDFSEVVGKLQTLPPGFDSPANREYARQFDTGEYAKKVVSLYEQLARDASARSCKSRASTG